MLPASVSAKRAAACAALRKTKLEVVKIGSACSPSPVRTWPARTASVSRRAGVCSSEDRVMGCTGDRTAFSPTAENANIASPGTSPFGVPMSLTLVIGNKNYSSWSFRPWLHMKHAGLDFREQIITLYRPGHVEDIKVYNPAGRVPVLFDGDLRIWDSLAICEYIAEKTGFGWPKVPAARAHARSVSAEMHSGFQTLRTLCPVNIRARRRIPMTPELGSDVARIDEIWRECRERHGAGGPWLFGAFSIADAMYA